MVVRSVWSGRIVQRARAELDGAEPGRLRAAADRLRRLPLRRRTLDELHVALASPVSVDPSTGVIDVPSTPVDQPAEAPTCAELGHHPPGCPHQAFRQG